MIDKIKLLKLVTGEVILGELLAINDIGSLFNHPVIIYEKNPNQLVIHPWLGFSKTSEILIYNTAIVAGPLDCDEELATKYLEMTGNIVTPSTNILLPH